MMMNYRSGKSLNFACIGFGAWTLILWFPLSLGYDRQQWRGKCIPPRGWHREQWKY